MEQVIRQAHYLITKIRAVTFTSFDNQCLDDEYSDYLLECSNREEYDCKLVLEKYSLKKCEEPSINLELAIGNGTTKTMHELTYAIIKNKKI
jgi:hypothetical protein